MATRDPQRTRRSLLAAASDVLRRHYLNETGDTAVLPISVTDVVNETASLTADSLVPVTPGAIKSAFGSKTDLLRAAAVDYGQEWFAARYSVSLAAHKLDPGVETFLDGCVRELAEHLPETRHWLLLSAHTGDPAIREYVETIRTKNLETLVSFCQVTAWDSNLTPADHWSWPRVAGALLVWLDGVCVATAEGRYARNGDRTERVKETVAGGLALWNQLTIPRTGRSAPNEMDEASLIKLFTKGFSELEIFRSDRSWLAANGAIRGADTRIPLRLVVPELDEFGYEAEATARVVTIRRGEQQPALADVGIALTRPAGEENVRASRIKITIVSGSGHEVSAWIEGLGQRPSATLRGVPLTPASPNDLTVRFEVERQQPGH